MTFWTRVSDFNRGSSLDMGMMPCGLFLSLLPCLIIIICDLDVFGVDIVKVLHIIAESLFSSHHSYFTLHHIITHHHFSLPEGATMEQLLDVLGETRLKKMARKNRRSRNQKIREGKVVLNERGEWVERD